MRTERAAWFKGKLEKKPKKSKKQFSGTLLNTYGWGQSLVILFFFGFLIFLAFSSFFFLVVLAARVSRCVFRSAGRA